MPDDFIGNIKRRDAQEQARQRAIAPRSSAPRPRRATKQPPAGKYGAGALKKACDKIIGSKQRNVDTNEELFNLGQLVAAGELTREQVESGIADAARRAGLPDKEIRLLLREDGGLAKGMSKPRDMSQKGIPAPTFINGKAVAAETPDDDDEERRVYLQPLGGVKTSVPMWVWEYGGYGRIMLGALTMFAGKPAAGKSTAVRWFASAITNGTLPGAWYGTPMKIGIYSPEEGVEDTLVPSLQVHGADLSMVSRVGVIDTGEESGLMSLRDEQRLVKELKDNGIRALFIDPVMQTFDGSVTDGHKNVETRAHLMPYVRVAQAINGLVICVHHLRKESVTDVMLAMQGSSAFGEIPRCVFGFASVGDGSNIMEQVKNSAGPTGLKLDYRMMVERREADDGQVMELPRFEIKGETELSITDLGGGGRDDEDATTATADVLWLERYLQVEQPAPSKRVKDEALKQADISVSRLHKARKKLKVRIISTPRDEAPHTTSWSLPGWRDSGSF